MKRLLALALSMVMVVGLLSGCGSGSTQNTSEEASQAEESAAEESTEASVEASEVSEASETTEEVTVADMLANSYYIYAFNVDTMQMTYFFHFYDEVPGVGRVFYAGMAMNQAVFVGTYEVLEEGIDYSVYMEREAAEATSGTSAYSVVFYDFDGNEIERLGLDEGVLYNDSETITSVGGSPCAYYLDADPENSEFKETYKAEAGQKILDFYNPDDVTCTIALYHTGTYMDLMNLFIEGTWGVEENADGTRTYTLTPDSDSDTPATLTVAADKQTAVYTPDGGDAVNVVTANPVSEEVGVFGVMTGDTTLGEGDGAMPATLTLNIMEDGTCKLLVNLYGTDYDLDAGTMSLASDGFTMNFVFDAAGELASELNMETYEITLEYVLESSDVGPIDAVLTLKSQE